MSDEPDHQALCEREQAWFLRTIREDIDLTRSMAEPSPACGSCWRRNRASTKARVVQL